MIGVYAGSFDPFTNGHLEIVSQASEIFDRIIVLVAENPEKRHWFSGPERQAVIKGSVAEDIEVATLTGTDTAVEYAYRLGACLVRGLGEFTDYPAEKTLSGANSRLRPEVKTVFLMTGNAGNQMRSSTVREALKYRFGWRSIRDTVPQATFNAALLKLLADRAQAAGLALRLDRDTLSRYLDRPYHNLGHLAYMLDLAELWNPGGSLVDPLDLWAAVIYHDLLVDSDPDVAAGEDVALSLKKMEEAELPGRSRQAVVEMIQATDHEHYTFAPAPNLNLTPAQKLMCGLDLAILGESPYEYTRYTEAVRLEYAPKYGYLSDAFRTGRLAFLRTALARLKAGPIINPEFDERMAVNLGRELAELTQPDSGGLTSRPEI